MSTSILDVTILEPRLKHPTIFEKFDSLNPGEDFIIHNDHDPKPLYYQLLAERGQTFVWEYVENGPEWWKVRIGKLAEGEKETTIGELVAKDYRKAQVFKKFGIDFCCGGKKTLSEVCNKKGIDIHRVEDELKNVDQQSQRTGDNYQNWELDFMCDYIINTHHNYVRESIPFLSEISQKVARVHGEHHPELVKVAEVFAGIAADLSMHLMKEENILFPYIKEMVLAKKTGMPLPQAQFGQVANPITVMEQEHEGAGEDLSEIRELTNNYDVPADACTSYRILFKKLEEFEDDLHQHVHMENNILFPKAIELEKQFK
ncbi:iron-sulfur cluster repair di-iron protein [Pararcticibacter amylolyticus]|uniref:Iron-sulfur cluster repair di-iron protein n=1 Tax=Pararcticibacter amylolyticus TaxID=2173175 RepID=A0A2U2PFS1_9SPHI|nr:iron-sulfur cluster repair di-iron protein [Pararcticibacter amylolyticus]PWG80251.1 iron-sulfur cluster repair di-iron protein [Pararcticibacter amylolyticus]